MSIPHRGICGCLLGTSLNRHDRKPLLCTYGTETFTYLNECKAKIESHKWIIHHKEIFFFGRYVGYLKWTTPGLWSTYIVVPNRKIATSFIFKNKDVFCLEDNKWYFKRMKY